MGKNSNNVDNQELAEALTAIGGILFGGLVVIGGFIMFIVSTVLLIPILYYLVGLLASVTFWGDWLVQGASKLGLAIAKGDLPVIFATLGAFGGFFRSNLKASKQNKQKDGNK